MASIIKRYGKWQARISWYDSEGKRQTKSQGGFPTKVLAKNWAVEQKAKLNKGINIKKTIKFIDYYDQWIETYKKPKVAEITYKRYEFTRKALNSFFADTEFKHIARKMYQRFINEYGATHAPHTVKEVNNIVRSCIRSAMLDDYLIKDFTQNVTLVANEDKEVKVDYLNVEEIKKLLEKAEAGISQQDIYTSRYMIITAIYTGMRLSEIQALTWNDINWLHQTITISKSWNMYTHSFKPTKNKSSNRTIKVNQTLLQLLSQLKEKHISNMVFMTQFGTIPTSNAVNKMLRQLLDELGIHRENFHFHSLRHSHVALLLAKGVDIYPISKRLGHSDIRTTMNTYAYLIDEYKGKTDDKIVNALNQL